MAQHILGLDLGAHAVKAVLLESTYRGFAVIDTAHAPVPPAEGEEPPPLLERQAGALAELLAARGWRVDEAVAAFPGSGVSATVVTLPFTDLRRIEQTVGFEVEGQIPFDLAEVAWDWQPLGVRDGKTDLLVAVTRKAELAALLEVLGRSGIDPRAVLPAGPAYAALLASGLAGEASPGAEGAEVVVDVGAERTSVCVATGGACVAARTFAFGAAHLARVLGGALGLDGAGSDAVVAAAGGSPTTAEAAAALADPRTGAALREGLAPLVREVRATLRAWRARAAGPAPVARLLLAGEAARLPALAELLAPEVEGPVAPLELSGAAGGRIAAEDAPGLALALSLALRGHQGPRGARLNLRRGDLAFTRDFEHLRGKVARLAGLAAALGLLALASAGVKAFTLSRQEAALDRALCDFEQKILGRCYPNFEEAQAILRGRGTPGAALPRVSAVDLLAELAERVPAQVSVRLDRIEITRDKLHLEGTTGSAEGVDRLVDALKGSRCFGDARSGSARKRATDGKFEFSIDSGLTCLESGPREGAGGRG